MHTLEDEQKATYDFSEKTITKAPSLNEPLTSAVEEKVVHSLEEEVVVPKTNLVKTTNEIVNMAVVYDDVEVEVASEDDFVITDITPVQEIPVVEELKAVEPNLLFDLPLKPQAQVETPKVKEVEEIQAEEVVFERKVVEKRYVLEDFDAQPTIGKSSGMVERKVAEEEINFELKTRTPQAQVNQIETQSEEVSPLDLTITELQKRAEERRKTMKGFNYKFNDQMNKNIDEIERQPAYKRLGINLDTNSPISSTKTSIQKNTDEISFKSNNYFLHDNVD